MPQAISSQKKKECIDYALAHLEIATAKLAADFGIGHSTISGWLKKAWRLPLDLKIKEGQGKWALRQILYKYVPKELIERPKAGFAVPIGQWLRGPLRDWAEDLLSENRLQSEGYLHPEPIRKVWKEHLSGRCDHSSRLWTILMFQSWLETNRGDH